ncbi:Rieske 2Fe-2S domain-containing protein [Pseudomaricurvus alcaniphilus]|uniref:aromatic ring-hydroxylating dioxygenase subunit alpha n=1 Tax=Pseudomaricurvus alcaniphilus TaxID=1166482 RepID=UPI00140C2217|nr:aromatic ring-hydroxylating dioxygenase subunit alpha [Pseudomaricurvus alcaniphilus]NHN39891.1 Rieske 2Fe-2S domain-containing protein [Pseudomaricurvus alcaniphilus]
MNLPLNCWYLAAWEKELPRGEHLARTIAEQPLLLMCDEEGNMAALLDRCPYRFALLSKGRFSECNKEVACGYHGLKFNSKGECLENPHGPITEKMCLKTFPVCHRYRGVWVWLGDPSKADPSLISDDLGDVEKYPETAQASGVLEVKANFQLLSDNILDLSHGDYLHPETVGGGSATRAKQSLEQDEKEIRVSWFCEKEKPLPLLASAFEENQLVDFNINVRWTPPSTMWLNFKNYPTGNPEGKGQDNLAFHIMTPVDSKTSLYFYWIGRGQDQDNKELNEIYHQTGIQVCSGLMAPDTLIRDNTSQRLRCHHEAKTHVQTVPQRV